MAMGWVGSLKRKSEGVRGGQSRINAHGRKRNKKQKQAGKTSEYYRPKRVSANPRGSSSSKTFIWTGLILDRVAKLTGKIQRITWEGCGPEASAEVSPCSSGPEAGDAHLTSFFTV
jgi:hypothetical protein